MLGLAARYNRLVGPISRHFLPSLLWLARMASGQCVLDIATGTGIAADAAAVAVGAAGHIVAADVSPAMLEGARRRLAWRLNVSLSGEDGQSLTRSDLEFDLVLCHFGLMFFADPMRGLSEFYRVLRPGGRAVVSVFAPHQMHLVSALRQEPSEAGTDPLSVMLTSIGDRTHIKELFSRAGFVDIEVVSQKCSILPLITPSIANDKPDTAHHGRPSGPDVQSGLAGSDLEVWFICGTRFRQRSVFGVPGDANWGYY